MDFKINFNCFVNKIMDYDPKDILSFIEKENKVYEILSHTVSSSEIDCSGAFNLPDIIDKTHLVYAIYSTGDEAMKYNNTSIEFIEVFLTEEKANRCKNQINANYSLFSYLSNGLTLNEKLLNDLSKNVINLPKDKNNRIDFFKLQNVYFQNENDEIKKLRSPWHGHFDSLDFVKLNSFTHSIKKKPKF